MIKSIPDRLVQFGAAARMRLKPAFEKAHVAYPPSTIALVGLKRERLLELWAGDDPENFHPIKTYRVSDVSGRSGPKLRQGDKQVPEGVYHVAAINPNSKFYLSLLLDYPNEMDRARAQQEGRSNLGGDITIHGGGASVSSLPVGQETIEELFTLAADTGPQKIRVIVAPWDLRKPGALSPESGSPAWSGELYQRIREELMAMTSRGG
jgi:murein L,D-transpeptidase YafK